MTGTHAEEMQLGKWAWGYMQTQYIRGHILYCTASKGQKRTKVETKMLTDFSLLPSSCHQKILMCCHILKAVPTLLAVPLWSS